MSHGLFAGSFPTTEKSIITTRQNAHIRLFSILHRALHAGSISPASIDELFINEALLEARASLAEGGIPIGCVLVRHGQIVARGHDRRIQGDSAILQAEMDCLEAAGQRPARFYHDYTLYTTLSPCAMSAGAIRFYGIPRVVIGENEIYHGDETLLRASHIQVHVLDSRECHQILKNYIKENPRVWNENIAHTAY